jgi:hypothetical protein
MVIEAELDRETTIAIGRRLKSLYAKTDLKLN